MLSKEAAAARDGALRDNEELKQELAGMHARLLAERKMAGEHKALAATSSSWEQVLSLLALLVQKCKY